MDIRQATADDADVIRGVARRSLEASYSQTLGAEEVDAAVEQWYAIAELEERLSDGDTLLLVADVDDEVVGFSQSVLVDGEPPTGEIHWVHVAPDHRGHGYGAQLLTRTEESLHGRGVGRIRALVLEANAVGNEFYEDRGFELVDEREVEIGDRTFAENAFAKDGGAGVGETDGLESHELPAGEAVYVDRSDPEQGSKGPFYPVYYDTDRDRKYGLYCDNCGSYDTAMDTMGRLECAECNNMRKPTRWDAAYL